MTGSTAAHLASQGGGHAALLAGSVDLEAMGGRGVVAPVAGIDEGAGQRGPDLRLEAGMTLSRVWPS